MSKTEETFRDIFLKGEFIEVYIKNLAPVISAYFSRALKTKGYDLFLEDDDREQKIKKVFNCFNQLTNVIDDLETTLIFIKISDHDKISKTFPEFEDTKTYYNYFIENYIIRINSLSDVLGKLLNLLYMTEMERPNLHSFRNKIQNEYPELNAMIIAFSERIKVTKDKRHEKLHEGSTEFEYLKSIVFWNDLHIITKVETPEILKQATQEDLCQMAKNISQEIQEYVILVRDILNISTTKLKEYLA